jgi:hypothetical protein
MKVAMSKFRCAQCGKESEPKEDRIYNKSTSVPHPFPYEQGWIFIYSCNIKVNAQNTLAIVNDHFCSENCLFGKIKDIILKENLKYANRYYREHQCPCP